MCQPKLFWISVGFAALAVFVLLPTFVYGYVRVFKAVTSEQSEQSPFWVRRDARLNLLLIGLAIFIAVVVTPTDLLLLHSGVFCQGGKRHGHKKHGSLLDSALEVHSVSWSAYVTVYMLCLFRSCLALTREQRRLEFRKYVWMVEFNSTYGNVFVWYRATVPLPLKQVIHALLWLSVAGSCLWPLLCCHVFFRNCHWSYSVPMATYLAICGTMLWAASHIDDVFDVVDLKQETATLLLTSAPLFLASLCFAWLSAIFGLPLAVRSLVDSVLAVAVCSTLLLDQTVSVLKRFRHFETLSLLTRDLDLMNRSMLSGSRPSVKAAALVQAAVDAKSGSSSALMHASAQQLSTARLASIANSSWAKGGLPKEDLKLCEVLATRKGFVSLMNVVVSQHCLEVMLFLIETTQFKSRVLSEIRQCVVHLYTEKPELFVELSTVKQIQKEEKDYHFHGKSRKKKKKNEKDSDYESQFADADTSADSDSSSNNTGTDTADSGAEDSVKGLVLSPPRPRRSSTLAALSSDMGVIGLGFARKLQSASVGESARMAMHIDMEGGGLPKTKMASSKQSSSSVILEMPVMNSGTITSVSTVTSPKSRRWRKRLKKKHKTKEEMAMEMLMFPQTEARRAEFGFLTGKYPSPEKLKNSELRIALEYMEKRKEKQRQHVAEQLAHARYESFAEDHCDDSPSNSPMKAMGLRLGAPRTSHKAKKLSVDSLLVIPQMRSGDGLSPAISEKTSEEELDSSAAAGVHSADYTPSMAESSTSQMADSVISTVEVKDSISGIESTVGVPVLVHGFSDKKGYMPVAAASMSLDAEVLGDSLYDTGDEENGVQRDALQSIIEEEKEKPQRETDEDTGDAHTHDDGDSLMRVPKLGALLPPVLGKLKDTSASGSTQLSSTAVGSWTTRSVGSREPASKASRSAFGAMMDRKKKRQANDESVLKPTSATRTSTGPMPGSGKPVASGFGLPQTPLSEDCEEEPASDPLLAFALALDDDEQVSDFEEEDENEEKGEDKEVEESKGKEEAVFYCKKDIGIVARESEDYLDKNMTAHSVSAMDMRTPEARGTETPDVEFGLLQFMAVPLMSVSPPHTKSDSGTLTPVVLGSLETGVVTRAESAPVPDSSHLHITSAPPKETPDTNSAPPSVLKPMIVHCKSTGGEHLKTGSGTHKVHFGFGLPPTERMKSAGRKLSVTRRKSQTLTMADLMSGKGLDLSRSRGQSMVSRTEMTMRNALRMSRDTVPAILDPARVHTVDFLPWDSKMRSYGLELMANLLHDKFIEERSVFAINVSYRTRKDVYHEFRKLHLRKHNSAATAGMDAGIILENETVVAAEDVVYDEGYLRLLVAMFVLFDEAIAEVFRLLETDTFARFKTSADYHRLRASLNPESAQKAEQLFLAGLSSELQKLAQAP